MLDRVSQCPIGWPNSDGVGAQRPRTFCLQPWISSGGQEAIELAASAGLILDPWQEWLTVESLGEDESGLWAAPEAGIDVPRQNGKGSFLEGRTLYGLVVLGEEIAHSAHRFATAKDAFRRVKQLFEATPDLMRHVKTISNTAAELGIEMRNGGRVLYHARTKAGGRGTGGDLIILDEAFALSKDHMDSLVPLLSARPNPQTIYTSSPPIEVTLGEVWLDIRKRGERGEEGLFWASWGTADQTLRRRHLDLDEVRRSNPGYGIRITAATVKRERVQLGKDGFLRERMGLWPDTAGDVVISTAQWEACKVARAERPESPVFSIDIAPDRRSAAIMMVGPSEDGTPLISVVDQRAGTDWIVPRVRQLVAKWDAHLWIIDEKSPAATEIRPLIDGEADEDVVALRPELAPILKRWAPGNEDKPIPHQGALITMNTVDAAIAWGWFVDRARRAGLRHLDEGPLNLAVQHGKARTLGDGSAWLRRSETDMCTLVGATQALWGLLAYPEVETEEYDALANIY